MPYVVSDGLKLRVSLNDVQENDLCSRRILDTVTDEYIEYTFNFGNPQSSLLTTLNAPKFVLVSLENTDYFLQSL